MPDPDAVPAALSRLARPSGAFAMLALDQREGLRTMMSGHTDRPIPDQALTDFKVEAARALTPAASAVLIDVDFGLSAVQRAGAIAPGCGLIVAADRLTQRPGGLVEWTEVNDDVFADDAIGAATDAYKFLVIWRRGEEAERERTVRAFVDGCRRRDRPAIVEGIVRAADGETLDPAGHAELAIEAAVELAHLGADLYKAEVPTLGATTDEEITAAAERLTAAIPCPWVVLSNGTPADRYPTAMLAACRGGADGFLAGRAIWTASLAAHDVTAHLGTVALPLLEDLGTAVDAAVAERAGRR